MKKIGIVKLRSALSASDATLQKEADAFLNKINEVEEFSFSRPSTSGPNVFFVMTGGSEIYFKDCYQKYPEPYVLLATGERNSLAASLEIVSFCHEQGKQAQLIYGEPKTIAEKLSIYLSCFEAKKKLASAKLGIIGTPSDWLIASNVDKKKCKKKLGVELINIPMSDLQERVDRHIIGDEKSYKKLILKTRRKQDLRESLYIYGGLKSLCKDYSLNGFTLRCFDLLQTRQQTACLAFGILNDEGIVSGCEGDVPSLLTMYLLNSLTGKSVFMANPSRFDMVEKKAVYAHCTCPFEMCESYRLSTHFESGIGFGIKGEFACQEVTACKIAPDLSDIRVIEGKILRNLDEANLCRTQIEVAFDEDISCLVDKPYGNHMLFVYGHHKKAIEALKKMLGF